MLKKEYVSMLVLILLVIAATAMITTAINNTKQSCQRVTEKELAEMIIRAKEKYDALDFEKMPKDQQEELTADFTDLARSYLATTYQQATEKKSPILYEQTWAVGAMYDFLSAGLTDSELKKLDDKIYFIADTYLEQQYALNAPPASEHIQGVDDNGWKAQIPNPYVPPVPELRN